MSKVSEKALAFNLALAKYPIPSQDDVFSINKARTSSTYQGKGKRKGTPGNYTYVYDEAKGQKKRSGDQLEFLFEPPKKGKPKRGYSEWMQMYRHFRTSGEVAQEIRDAAKAQDMSARQYLVNALRDAEQREAMLRGETGDYDLDRVLDLPAPQATVPFPYRVTMKPDSAYQNIVHPTFEDSAWANPSWSPDLSSYDQIVVSSSGGKDSQAMLDRIVELADEQGVSRDKIIVIHADLGRAEWDNTKKLAKAQANRYGVRFHVVWRESGDLLDHVLERFDKLSQKQQDEAAIQLSGVRTWDQLLEIGAPAIAKIMEGVDTVETTQAGQSEARSIATPVDRAKKMLTNVKAHKIKAQEKAEKKAIEAEEKAEMLEREQPQSRRAQSARAKAVDLREKAEKAKLINFGEVVPWFSSAARYCTSDHKRSQINRALTAIQNRIKAGDKSKKPRILNCQGLRAQESKSRAQKPGFFHNREKKARHEDVWYPIQSWSEEKVWDRIKASGAPHAKAYDLGMSRLSCVFCVLASEWDLRTAAYNNPDLLEEYLAVEQATGKTFREDLSISDLKTWVQKPENVKTLQSHLKTRQGSKLYLPGGDMGGLVQIGEPITKAMRRYLTDVFVKAIAEIETRENAPVEKIVFDYKATGACLHFDTAMRSIHVTYFTYPHAYGAALEVYAIANKLGLPVEEHGAPNES